MLRYGYRKQNGVKLTQDRRKDMNKLQEIAVDIAGYTPSEGLSVGFTVGGSYNPSGSKDSRINAVRRAASLCGHSVTERQAGLIDEVCRNLGYHNEFLEAWVALGKTR